MPRSRLFIVFGLALMAGGALAFGTYRYLQNLPVKTVSAPTAPVVVAAIDLRIGAALRPEDLEVQQWPQESVPDGAFADLDALAGRGLLASVVRHEPILSSKVAPEGAGAGLPPVIPAGYRAMSVRVNEVIGVAGYVLPGTRVDVIATASPSDDRADTTSKLVLSNVQVLTAGTRMEQAGDGGEPVGVTVVTLLVDPHQAERLTLASTEGKIQLALRNPLDEGAPETTGIRPAALLGHGGPAPAPARRPRAAASAPPPQPFTVEIIRGNQRDNEPVS